MRLLAPSGWALRGAPNNKMRIKMVKMFISVPQSAWWCDGSPLVTTGRSTSWCRVILLRVRPDVKGLGNDTAPVFLDCHHPELSAILFFEGLADSAPQSPFVARLFLSSRNRRRDDANHRGPLSDDLFRRLD